MLPLPFDNGDDEKFIAGGWSNVDDELVDDGETDDDDDDWQAIKSLDEYSGLIVSTKNSK